MTNQSSATTTIIGAGAIGCYVWGHWLGSLPNLRLLGRLPINEQLKANGLKLSGDKNLQVAPQAIETDAQCLKHSELIVLTTKSTGLKKTISDIRKHTKPGTPIISLLNGLSPVSDLNAALPGHPVIAGMVPFNVVWQSNNHLHRSSAGTLALQRTQISERIAARVADSGVPIELHDELKPIQHGKLLLNLINPINALSGLMLHDQLSQRGYREIYAAVVKEALEIYAATEIAYVKAGPFPPKLANALLRLPDAIFNTTILKIQKIDRQSRTSMATDYIAKKPTEIDAINGEIVHQAKNAGIPAPLNSKIVELIKSAEKNAWPTYTSTELKAQLNL